MPKKFKKINKQNAVTFQLVHRSQQDPLVASEDAPQRILLPVENKNTKKSREEELEQQHKYGIFYDDESNYLQYLKDVKDNQMEWPKHAEAELVKKEEAKILLPSSVFASEVEEEVGMLNKAAPVSGLQLHLDPDVVAAMDEDFDYSDPENQLEDNFIQLANGGGYEEIDSNFDDEEVDEVCSLPGSRHSFDDEETKSKFTNYSMSSSVIRRNEQLTLLDRRFEKAFEEYDGNKIDSFDCEDTEGYIPNNSDILLRMADEFVKSQQRHGLSAHDLADRIKELAIKQQNDKEEFVSLPINETRKYDCETILSTYSSFCNQPKTIDEPNHPKKDKTASKNKANVSKLGSDKSASDDEESASVGEQSVISRLSVLSVRHKDESPEEKRERKRNLKEYRRERRKEKKLNKEAFTQEAKRQTKILINNRNNVQGNKLL
ncbi:hypothetical protein NQ315_009124 [Exocentrus adspersus]|uniref:Protein LTV1 homolog n=1 Tax=Exocentrus adspersus TaxID=1586481 RepID=A0AAV8WGU3_9CUCU|nr:hypothetical protein NQ315_009124 [Exocentrus adspersus]